MNNFFDPHQRATIEAAMARMIPTDDHPGAPEAGTIEFLDRYLSGLGRIYAKPDGSGFETLRASAPKPGSGGSRSCAQNILKVSPSSTGAAGTSSGPFVELDAEQQDGSPRRRGTGPAGGSGTPHNTGGFRTRRAGAAADQHRDRA